VPSARVAIGHGQMTEKEMEKTVRAFVAGQFDVLVSTTIVENGLDLPRANTILIERADLFGLAELHQLRGRVGRSDHKAYCFLLMDRDAPPDEEARKRLKAIEEFSHLGSGFAIAIKDLEIRGAGNLLGPQQSGHIAAIGYEMYCRLLREAVHGVQQKGERPAAKPVAEEDLEVDVDLRISAYLPAEFVADPRLRLELLREMDGATSEEALAAITASLQDRFGKCPPPVEALLRVFLLKHLLAPQGVRAVQLVEADRVVVHHRADRQLGGSWLDAFLGVRLVEGGKTHLMLPKPGGDPGPAALAFLLDALLGRRSSPTMSTRCAPTERTRERRR
jgi:transcription-repair coupling factor (superfamily II helicase)